MTSDLPRLHDRLGGLGGRGRAMLAAFLGGQEHFEALSKRVRGRPREKLPEPRWALEGRVRAHRTRALSGRARGVRMP
jgi:hypothetical protein